MMNLFYRGRRVRSASRPLALLLPMLLLFALAVGGTMALLIDRTGSVQNTFTPGTVTPEIDEDFDGKVKENVRIRNTGNAPGFVRAVLTVNWVDNAGNVLAPAKEGADYTIEGLPGSDWFVKDGFYYYSSAVEDGGATGYLFTRCAPVADAAPAGGHLQVSIAAQAVQATADAVANAWGSGLSVQGGNLSAQQ